MNINKVKSLNHLLLLFFTALLLLSSCGALAYKRADVKDSPINDSDKRKKKYGRRS